MSGPSASAPPTPTDPDAPTPTELPTTRATVTAWLFGLVALAAVVGGILHAGELTELLRLLRGMQPSWLLAAAALQGLTYVCAASVWRVALARQGHHLRLSALVPVAFAMLFTNQAFPSGGVSGSVVVVRALRRRHVPAHDVMAALLVGLLSTYQATLLAVIIALPTLRAFHVDQPRVLGVLGAFALVAVIVPVAVIRYWQRVAPALRARWPRLAGVADALTVVEQTPTEMLGDRRLGLRVVAVQFAEIVLDAATLHVMLMALGVEVPVMATFGSFVVASAVFHVIPVPMGLGTFEGALVTTLHLVRVPIEAALAATLLLRGFTMWLPMAPGLWWARRELTGRAGHH